jgi:branched-chain amino acid transport system substrate-binding protein
MRNKRLWIVAIVAALIVVAAVPLTQAQDSMVIKIASQGPLSGGQSAQGTALRNGVELAIEQFGGSLTEAGFEIQFVPFDDQASPDVGVANAQQLVADPAILGVIGHWNSGVAIPSSEVYEANNVAMISPANTNPAVTDRGLTVVNRVCGRDDLQGPLGARFAASLEGVEEIYILHDTTTYGQGVAEFFRQEAEAQGLTVLAFEGTEERANFEGVIQPILALAPDLIYMGGIYDQFGVFVQQVRTAGYEGALLGPDGMDAPDFANIAGEAGIGVYYTSAAGPAAAYENSAAFIEAYEAKFGAPPLPYTAQAYDATGILLQAIEAAAMEAGGTVPTREAVAAAVRATTDYAGVTGMVTFDANGDPQVANYFILQVATADAAEWVNNTSIQQIELPSPLFAAEMTPEAEMMEEMEMTPEATAES